MIKETLAAMFAAAFIAFTGMGLVPPEAFVGVAVAVVMHYFKEKEKDDLRAEITRLKGGKR